VATWSAVRLPADSPPPAGRAGRAGRLTATGRRIRLVVTLVVGGLLVAGTFWGADDDFPFGPFRMYAWTVEPDGTVHSSRLEGVDATGRRVDLSPATTGLRRSELELRLRRFQTEPELLGEVATSYQRRHPDAPPIVRVEVYRRHQRLRDGQPSGEPTDQLVVSWDDPQAADR
jgi:hypothetical protein